MPASLAHIHSDTPMGANLVAGASFSYRVGNPYPGMPVPCRSADSHGTAVAGLVLAREGNAIGGAGVAIYRDPHVLTVLGAMEFAPRWPTFPLADIRWTDVVVGVVFLALPQVPLTLGNAVIAITEENNRLFPDRPVTERGVFGSPFVFADGEPFWGADRFEMLDRWLSRGGW